MKTNYVSYRTKEAREAIKSIKKYASKNASRTKGKSNHYSRISDQCQRDLDTYGFEAD